MIGHRRNDGGQTRRAVEDPGLSQRRRSVKTPVSGCDETLHQPAILFLGTGAVQSSEPSSGFEVGDSVTLDEDLFHVVTLEKLAKLPTVFDKENGTVSAGNSSGITDGAAALLLMTAEKADQLGLPPLAVVGESTQVGLDPTVMGLGPVPAVEALQAKNGLAVDDYDLIELNEAFAAQSIACIDDLGLDMDRTNLDGGAIALGHPLGATGARITGKAAQILKRENKQIALASQCIGGGQGIATILEAA